MFTKLWVGLWVTNRNCEAPGASNSEGLFITPRVEVPSTQHPGVVAIGEESKPICSNLAGESQTPHYYFPSIFWMVSPIA